MRGHLSSLFLSVPSLITSTIVFARLATRSFESVENANDQRHRQRNSGVAPRERDDTKAGRAESNNVSSRVLSPPRRCLRAQAHRIRKAALASQGDEG